MLDPIASQAFRLNSSDVIVTSIIVLPLEEHSHDYASLRHIVPYVSTGRGEGRFKTRHYVILHVFLRHTFLLPVEIRNSCLTEARVCHRFKAMPDYASLRHEFRVLTGRRQISITRHWRHCYIPFLRHTFHSPRLNVQELVTSQVSLFCHLTVNTVGYKKSPGHAILFCLLSCSRDHLTYRAEGMLQLR